MITKTRFANFFACLLTGASLLTACHEGETKKAGNPSAATTDTRPAGKAVIKYAKGFNIDYIGRYKLVHTFTHTGDKTDTLEYILLPQGDPVPAGHPGATLIRTPASTMVVLSSVHVAMADFAGVADRIIGLGSLQYIYSPLVRANIKTGKVKQVGMDGDLNNELLITMHPGLVMASTNPDAAGGGKYKTLTDAGIPVIQNADWLETTPLGRAEWVKLLAALVNTEDSVNKKFDSLEQTYNQLAQLGQHTTNHPRVIIAMPFKGTWFMPAGESYMANFLKDAGAAYKWSDSRGVGSLSLNFETAAPEALQADYWLNIGTVNTKKEITEKDIRYGSFKSFKTGQLYNNTNRVNDLGSNDYWESGVVNPQLVLADMIKILHPDLLQDHQLVYYKQIQ